MVELDTHSRPRLAVLRRNNELMSIIKYIERSVSALRLSQRLTHTELKTSDIRRQSPFAALYIVFPKSPLL
jgi:hypothetical protein